MVKASDTEKQALDAAVLTVSDTRTEENDTSGQYLAEALASAGHRVADHRIVKDDVYQIRAVLSGWIADSGVDAVLVGEALMREEDIGTKVGELLGA